VLACFPQGRTDTLITIGSPTYVCVVVNDRYVAMAQVRCFPFARAPSRGPLRAGPFARAHATLRSHFSPQPFADEYTRLVISGSANATVTDGSQPNPCLNKFWAPLGCDETIPVTLGGQPYTNYYVVAGGKVINYKKTFVAYPNADGGSTYLLPISTVVIQVNNGVVQSVYWDDGCYFCPPADAVSGVDAACGDGVTDCQQCLPNAYNLTTNQPLTSISYSGQGNDTNSDAGSDCAILQTNCFASSGSKSGPPSGFCDLGIYVTWYGTDSAGVSLASAGLRFRRFRSYAMQPQLDAMQAWTPGGNAVTGSVPTASSTTTTTGRRFLDDGAAVELPVHLENL